MSDADLNEGDELAIAIVGMAGRFPGAPDVERYWRNLCEGVEGIRFFTDDELRARGVPEERLRQPGFVRAGAVLDQVEAFDAGFFGYSPREAALMDPQHRIFLECAWEAIERAGHGLDTESRSVGVFAGTSLSTYLLFNLRTHPELLESSDSFQVMIGNDKDFLATRLAYHLDLKGPSLDVQTGCSTSLVATHLACQALMGFQCDVAIAGGVSVDVPQRTGYVHQPGGIASPDGHCRPFDARAQGTLFGSGVGVVVLKRLDDALADGSHIHAVIRASAINNDGASKLGYTAPSAEGQAEVIARTHALAGVTPDTVGYVETHGTGTLLGDPVEVSALTSAFRAGTEATSFCALGSVKSNIGHLDAAAGVAGLIKAALAVEHGCIPPTLHLQTPNPNIDWARSPFFVNATLKEWKPHGHRRRAGVSSFGIGGTNAHALLEAPPAPAPSGPSRPWQLLVLSAKQPAALDVMTRNLAAHLEAHPEQSLADAAYTLQLGRKAFPHRRVVVCESHEDGAEVLSAASSDRVFTDLAKDGGRPVVFLFPGGGAQHLRMGQELYEKEPAFREAFDACAALFQRRGGPSLRAVLYPAGDADAGAPLPRPSVGLPALFTVEYALAKLWESWGVRPEAMIGHSMGEYVAACLAGVFTLEDALALVAERGRLFEQLPSGAMVSVALSEQELLPMLGERLSLAAVNGPTQCVVAGDTASVDALAADLAARGIEHRRVHIDVAAHSHLIDSILPAFAAFVGRLKLQTPTQRFVSGVTGTWVTEEEATDPRYWVRHLRQTVRFGPGLRCLLEDPSRVLLEVGPGRTLGSLARLQVERGQPTVVLTSMRAPREPGSDLRFVLTTLGRLWAAGVPVDWRRLHGTEQRRRVVLPTYPFERKRHWMEPNTLSAAVVSDAGLARRKDPADWFYLPSWKRTLAPRAPAATPRHWLLFTDASGVGGALAARLEEGGGRVTRVSPGSDFRRVDDGGFEVDPARPETYAALLAALAAESQRPERIVHLWSVDDAGDGVAGVAHAQRTGFFSLLFLAQALAGQGASSPVHLTVVSTGVQAVTGHEVLAPEKATLLGACRVLPHEVPGLSCRSIDVEAPGCSEAQRLLAARLADELSAGSSNGAVALRGPHRWEQSLEPVRLPAPAPDAPSRLRPRGTYLITGGLGGIGLVLAESLARQVQARLVLVSRSGLPERGDWDAWLTTHGDQDRTSQRLRQVLALEALGSEVLVLSADVGDAEQLEEVLRKAREAFGELHGVIHAAGVPAGGLAQLRTQAAVEDVLRPKVLGTWLLHALLRDTPLDFFMLCSSRTAYTAEPGQIDHCAACAFQDAFAHKAAVTGGAPVISLGWDTWREVGQAVTTQMPDGASAMRDAMLAHALSPAEGVDVFERVLAQAPAHVVVSTEDLRAAMARSASFLQDLMGPMETDAAPTAARAVPTNMDEAERELADIWQRFLGVERVSLHENFFELGGNSLIGLKVINEVKRRFGKELPVVALFENPTLSAMARLLTRGEEAAPATTSDRRSRGARRRELIQQRRQSGH
ncbi:type I polyketide synthase [Corallococcus macrosporus]|uniref:Phenolphthiocerol/phthiocerol polyketide synthase subunit E n=1 Tax=Myxococcus fulvus (strain ATCC BAA-855 / HW-1) TaxID=483219 RepID=F8CAS9_MYXFH|nr:type I polyketide synthase [Corallococcus macrosporus]AEI67131.1 polyketide synthase type I [Corallococcus macrosporus]